MMRSPCASAAETGAGQRRPTAGASGSEVTSQTAIRAAAARALQAPPALWACTMSMRSAVTRLSRILAFLRSRSGLRAALGRFIHSPPNALSSPTSGPSSAAIRARAPACSRAKRDVEGGPGAGLLEHRRHDLQYGGAGERAPRNARPLEAVAHRGASFRQPGVPQP